MPRLPEHLIRPRRFRCDLRIAINQELVGATHDLLDPALYPKTNVRGTLNIDQYGRTIFPLCIIAVRASAEHMDLAIIGHAGEHHRVTGPFLMEGVKFLQDAIFVRAGHALKLEVTVHKRMEDPVIWVAAAVQVPA